MLFATMLGGRMEEEWNGEDGGGALGAGPALSDAFIFKNPREEEGGTKIREVSPWLNHGAVPWLSP